MITFERQSLDIGTHDRRCERGDVRMYACHYPSDGRRHARRDVHQTSHTMQTRTSRSNSTVSQFLRYRIRIESPAARFSVLCVPSRAPQPGEQQVTWRRRRVRITERMSIG